MATEAQTRDKCIPGPLRNHKQWVCWKYHSGPGDGRDRKRKVPVDPKTGRFAKVTDSSTWTTLDEAEGTLMKHGGRLEGVGFVLPRMIPSSVLIWTMYSIRKPNDSIPGHSRSLIHWTAIPKSLPLELV